ncbi:SPX domain-containing protein [Flagelloscypha sp. PMI_526]|nr:SPX domain-containing protein [Flagelloscypha sp. PMI_526]
MTHVPDDIPLQDLSFRKYQAKMKFSSSLKFNAVPEWWDEYIAYDALKKYIYQLEKQQHQRNTSRAQPTDIEAGEHEPLKVVLFYQQQEKEILDEVEELEQQIKEQEEEGSRGIDNYTIEEEDEDEDDDDDDDQQDSHARERSTSQPRQKRRPGRSLSMSTSVPPFTGENGTSPLSPRARRYSMSSSEGDLEDSVDQLRNSGTWGRFTTRIRDSFISTGEAAVSIWTGQSRYAQDTQLLFKRRITTVYVAVNSLRSYVDVNYSGFRKSLKKYDKVTDSNLQRTYLHNTVETSLPFTAASKSKLSALSRELIDLYTKCVTRGDRRRAKTELGLHQREKIAWERDTVWRQMIGHERRGKGPTSGRMFGGSLMQDGNDSEEEGKQVKTPVGNVKLTFKHLWLAIALAVFAVLLNVKSVDGEEANKCFAVLVFCTILWASEAIPLFVTSLLVPLLLVTLRVIRDADENPLDAGDATHYVFSIMFSPTIMLLIGGFTISSALSKTNIDRMLITRVLSVAGTRPRTVLLAFMGVSCFASMLISNPILRTLPPKSSFAPCLILAIALAANIGGQSSPISSPQNLIALGEMKPTLSWGGWFVVALPVSFISIILIWLLLLVSYRPELTPDGEGMLEIKAIRATRDSWTWKQVWVGVVSIGTIALWCVAQQDAVKELFGDMGVIALLPVVLFFGTGVLKKDDFEQFAWTIVFLAMGGIALGKGVITSGLLKIVDLLIKDLVQGLSLYNVVLILSPVVLIISTFISHTIAAILLVPIAKEVGASFPDQNYSNLLIFIVALICSTGMGMPVSGFPNQTAATQEDDLGQLYLTNVDFLKNGVPASIIATLVVSTVGYLLMQAIQLNVGV